MNVLDKRESDMVTRYKDKLQNIHLTNYNSTKINPDFR